MLRGEGEGRNRLKTQGERKGKYVKAEEMTESASFFWRTESDVMDCHGLGQMFNIS